MLMIKKLFIYGMIALLCMTLSACKQEQASNGQNSNIIKSYNVFGPNDKELVSSDSRHFSLIGRLIAPNGSFCTASLVWKNLILTAAHCVFSNGEFMKGNYKFLLGASQGKNVAESEISYVWWGTTNPQAHRDLDWAIIKLTKPLGEQYGYFGWKTSTEELQNGFMQAGYGNLFYKGESMTEVKKCSMKAIFEEKGLLYHDCDSSQGDSGSPLFTCDKSICFILALHVAEYRNGKDASLVLDQYSDQNANIAIFTKSFSSKLKELRNQNP